MNELSEVAMAKDEFSTACKRRPKDNINIWGTENDYYWIQITGRSDDMETNSSTGEQDIPSASAGDSQPMEPTIH